MPVVVIAYAVAVSLSATEPAQRATELKWVADLESAREAALKEERPMLLFVTMDGCAHCQRMKQTTLRDKGVQGDLQTSFIPVAFNVKDQPELAKRLRLRLFPAVVILGADGEVLQSISGYQTPKQLREKLSSVIRQAARDTQPRTTR